MHRAQITRWFSVTYTLIGSLFSPSLLADDWQDNLYINSFFSLGLTQSDTDIGMVNAAGERQLYEKGKPSLNSSIAGAQIQFQMTDNVSLFVQGAAYVDRDKNLGHDIDWAYINYDFQNDFSLRLGQFQTPFLQGTEMRKVGYSRLWTRPLTPGNGASGFNEYKGMELVKKYSVGDHYWDFQFGLGQAEHQKSEVNNKNIKVATVRYQHQESWLRFGLLQGNYSLYSPVTGQAIDEHGQLFLASVEAETRLNHFVINAGLSVGDSDSTPDDSMQYLSIGYTMGDVTPYVFASRKKQVMTPPNDPGAGNGNGQQPDRPQRPGLENQPQRPAQSTTSFATNDYSVAAGFRWNLSENLALKTQLEKNRFQNRPRGSAEIINTRGTVLNLVLEGVY